MPGNKRRKRVVGEVCAKEALLVVPEIVPDCTGVWQRDTDRFLLGVIAWPLCDCILVPWNMDFISHVTVRAFNCGVVCWY